MNDKIGVTELKQILINSMPNIYSKHAYIKDFDCESITFNKAVKMFERMETSESIYEGLVEPSNKKPTREYANRAGNSRQNRGEASSSWTSPEKVESAGKHRKSYVDRPTGKLKTCLIHGPGHSSEECKVLGDFGTKYAKSRPTEDHGNSPVPRKKINRHQ